MPNKETFTFKPCTLETIDVAFYEHIKDVFNIHTISNSGFVKVPVLWGGAERAFQTKADSKIRDTAGKLILPLITIERTGLQKDPSFKGAVQADIPRERIGPRGYREAAFSVVRKINQEKTAQRMAARNRAKYGDNAFYPGVFDKQVVYDEYFIPVPTYVAVTYSVVLRSEYQQQMNQMVLPFISTTGQVNHFVVKKDNHRFESFIQQDFSQSNNINNLGEEERKFETKVEIKVLGYVIGDGINNKTPKIIKKESVVTVFAPIETVVSEIGSRCFKIDERLISVDEEDRTVYAVKEVITQDNSSGDSPETTFRKVTPQNYIPGQGDVKLDTAIEESLEEVACEDE